MMPRWVLPMVSTVMLASTRQAAAAPPETFVSPAPNTLAASPSVAALPGPAAPRASANPPASGSSPAWVEPAAVAEPPGYRMDAYRAPTPATLRGAEVLTTDQAHELWQRHQAAFIDVLPRPPRPAGLPESSIWRPKPRLDIPGSIWLPDTGYGTLAPVMDAYLEDGLAKASAGDHGRVLIFYCLANCWMSWNAAKRAMTFGYTHVAWYRDGTDGWEARGWPMEAREPVPRPNVTE